MLHLLNAFSRSRKFWFLLIFTIISLESVSLFLQYIFSLKPCVLCVYQRCALYGIGIAGLIAIISPLITYLRCLAISIWIYSAWKGLLLAKEHTDIQLHPSPFFTCELFVTFPSWLPLNKWWPAMFNAYGDCTEYKWYFLSLEISQWMFTIFLIYLITAILIFLSQIVNFRK